MSNAPSLFYGDILSFPSADYSRSLDLISFPQKRRTRLRCIKIECSQQIVEAHTLNQTLGRATLESRYRI